LVCRKNAAEYKSMGVKQKSCSNFYSKCKKQALDGRYLDDFFPSKTIRDFNSPDMKLAAFVLYDPDQHFPGSEKRSHVMTYLAP